MLCDWVEHGARWLQPIVRQMKAELLAGDYLQVDETPVKVMDPEVKGKCAIGYLWLASQPGGDVIFEFHPGRGKEYAKELLGDFSGYLQRDGYGVYGALVKDHPGRFKPCGCMAHFRRKLVDGLDAQPKEAEWLVIEMRKLYLIERHTREERMNAEQRHALRHQLAPPILAGIKARMDELRPGLLPQSPLGKAISYGLAEWDALNRYLEDGRLEIDNNLTENVMPSSALRFLCREARNAEERAWKSWITSIWRRICDASLGITNGLSAALRDQAIEQLPPEQRLPEVRPWRRSGETCGK
jgi:transposase